MKRVALTLLVLSLVSPALAQEWDEPTEETQKLTASDGEEGEYFGRSVSVSGEVAIVGAYGDDDNGGQSGSAYVLRYDPDKEEWGEEQKLTASDGKQSEFLLFPPLLRVG